MLRTINKIGLNVILIIIGFALILVSFVFLSVNRFPEASLKYVDDYLLVDFDINYGGLKKTGSVLTPKLSFTQISILNSSGKRIFNAEETTFSIKILSSIISFAPQLKEITLMMGGQEFMSRELNFDKDKLNFLNLNYQLHSNFLNLDTGDIYFKKVN